MRRLFIVGAKLLGLLCLWWAIFTTLQILSYSGTFRVYEGILEKKWVFVISMILYGLGLMAYFVLAICFAFVLLFRTEWIAEKVGFDKENELPGWPEEHKLLSLGVVLLGFCVLTHAIPGAVKSSLTLLGVFLIKQQSGLGGFFLHYLVPVLRDVLEVAVGFLLILTPARIIQWVERAQKSLEHKLTRLEGDVEKAEQKE